MSAPRLCLTLKRPWPWAIRHGGKRVENRPWAPKDGSTLYGARLVLHVGLGWDSDGVNWMRRDLGLAVPGAGWRGVPDLDPSCCPGALFAEATLLGAANLGSGERRGAPASNRDSEDRWSFGPWAWFLDDIRFADRVVLARGSQGLWTRRDGADWPDFVAVQP